MPSLTFSEPEIQHLFGHEAAEDENIQRLREYYFKTSTYEQIITDLPLRILVGHKGIGKSALFQVAIAEDREDSHLALLIKPDDVAGLGTDPTDFLKTIREWKHGLLEIIAKKALLSLGLGSEGLQDRLKRFGGRVVDVLHETLRDLKPVNYAPAQRLVLESFLNNRSIWVYIDDLDRGWQGRRLDVSRISALLNAVRDIVNESPRLRIRIGLRPDVYYLVRTSDESTDKIEGSVIWHTWTNHEIFVLLVKRIETFFGRKVDEQALLQTPQRDLAKYLTPVMDTSFQGQGHWRDAPMYRVLMSLIRKRPRDLVKLCTLAARSAREARQSKISTRNFEAVFEEYSQGRVQDTINEFRSELPDIEKLLLNMKPNRKERLAKQGYVYKSGALLEKIRSIMTTGSFEFASAKPATARELAAFMYKINFLTARKEMPNGIVRKYFEENRYLTSSFADFGFDWEIHPAYRWALQPDSVAAIFESLKLSAD